MAGSELIARVMDTREFGGDMKSGLTAGGGLLLGMLVGIIFGKLALGMIFGLLIGAVVAARRARTGS
jgi:uncharacterized protein YqgC (DUF456 family)